MSVLKHVELKMCLGTQRIRSKFTRMMRKNEASVMAIGLALKAALAKLFSMQALLQK